MAIEVKVVQTKPWRFYITNGTCNIWANIGRHLNHTLDRCVESGLQLCFRGKPIAPNSVITNSQWNEELDGLAELPTTFAAGAAVIVVKPSEEEEAKILLARQMAIKKVKGGLRTKDLLCLLPNHYVLVFYPDTFVVWDKHYIAGLNLINPDAFIKDLI